MTDISFNIARKELKIAQIAQLYQLFRLLHLIHIYGHGFYELSRMLMRKNVNNDVSKDSLIGDNTSRVRDLKRASKTQANLENLPASNILLHFEFFATVRPSLHDFNFRGVHLY